MESATSLITEQTLRTFCSDKADDDLDLRRPMTLGGWTLATNRNVIFAIRGFAMDFGAGPDSVSKVFDELATSPRPYRVPLTLIRNWALEFDLERCVRDDYCAECGRKMPGRYLGQDLQRVGLGSEGIVVNRELLRQVLYPLRRLCLAIVPAIAEVGCGRPQWTRQVREAHSLCIATGDVFVVVMPCLAADESDNPKTMVGSDPFDLGPYLVAPGDSVRAAGFE